MILRNAIRCKHCGDEIESKHRRDFNQCACGKVFVDGGKEYLRRGYPSGVPEDHYEELSEETEKAPAATRAL